ncbi:MAG: T9SS type A sorting domain-containing protein [Saprospiraceae bacterium]|nr:T9SS type A sorting domain-containing protein [Saprospiraceae bacterium]
MRNLACFLFSWIALFSFQVGHAQSPLDLVPLSQVTHTAQTSGDWTNPSTWGGTVPTTGARVHIPSSITITVDALIAERIKTLRIDGKLDFSTTVNTELKVETIVGGTGGELEIGTLSNPIDPTVQAKITFIDEGALDLTLDFEQYGKGMILMGKTTAYGAEKTSWRSLQNAPLAGENTITLSQPATNWEVGDEIVITGTVYNNPESDEKRSISAINGTVITLDQPLVLDHQTPSSQLEVHVANLSRNIILSSENSTISRRGHVMFMHNLDADLNYVRFYQLGRTNKQIQLDDWHFPTLVADDFYAGNRTNIRGRYSCHFHRGGVNPATTTAAIVKGCVVEDDPGWAYVNHSSHVDFIENVSYNVVGGAFQTESGDEIGSFQRNIAIRTVNPDYPILDPQTEPVDIREETQDFAFQGDAYWLHGGGVSLVDNIASGSSGHGFIFWTEGQREVGTIFDLQNMFKVTNIPNGNLLPNLDYIQSWWIPLKEFKRNIAYSSTKGLAAYYVHATLFEDITELTDAYLETVHSNFEDLTLWNIRKYGIELQNCERFTFKNLKMYNEGDPDVIAVLNTITVARESNWVNCNIEGFGVGMVPAMQGNVNICGGTFSNRWDFQIVPPQRDSRAPGWDRDLRIEGVSFQNSPYFSSNELIRFKMEGQNALEGNLSFVEEDFQNMFFMIPDRIMVNVDGIENKRLFYDEQDGSYVPITNSNLFFATGSFVNDVLNKTNQELYNDFQISFAGSLLPSDAVNHTHVSGGKVSSQDPLMSFPICHYLDEPLLPANSYDGFDFYDCWGTSSAKTGNASSPNSNACSSLIPVQEIEAEDKLIRLYPNPTNHYFRVEGLTQFSIQLYSVSGQLLYSQDNLQEGDEVSIDWLPWGVYFAKINDEVNRQHVLKIVKGY